MKALKKYCVTVLLLALMLLPLQSVQAKGLAEGPIFGTNYTLKSGDTLNDDLVVFGGSVSIEKDAKVNGSVVLFGGSLTSDGIVSKDVVVLGGAVKLESSAHIKGNLVTFGATVSRDEGAKVDGDVINNPTRPEIPNMPVIPNVPSIPSSPSNYSNPILNVLGIIGQSIILALLAMLIAMFLPLHMRRVADGVVSKPFMAFGMGLLTLVVFIVAIVALALFSILIITLILTIPMIVIASISFAAACVLGWLAMGMEVGVRIAQMFKSEWPVPLSAGLGVFILNLVAQGAGFIPCIGGLMFAIVGFAGLGAVVMTRFGTRVSLSSAPEIVTPPPPQG